MLSVSTSHLTLEFGFQNILLILFGLLANISASLILIRASGSTLIYCVHKLVK
jgi:hypothetical protein